MLDLVIRYVFNCSNPLLTGALFMAAGPVLVARGLYEAVVSLVTPRSAARQEPPAPGYLPKEAAPKSLDTVETVWRMDAAGEGYTVADIVSEFTFLSGEDSLLQVVATSWYNHNTGTAIPAPPAEHRHRENDSEGTTISHISDHVLPDPTGGYVVIDGEGNRLDVEVCKG